MGRVVDDTSGDGIARAIVTISSTTLPGGDLPDGGGGGRAVMTDARGRFLFIGLPGSTYAVTVQMRGYSLAETVRTNRGNGLRIQLAPGERLTDLAVRRREGAISEVFSTRPASRWFCRVARVFRRSIVAGRLQFIPASTVQTDDRGIYRASGLPPGRYHRRRRELSQHANGQHDR